jgi:hypothetical protein
LEGTPESTPVAFGMRAYPGGTWLPRAGVVRMPPTWTEAPGGAHPWEREIAAGELELPEPETERPPRIAYVDDVEETGQRRTTIGYRVRDLGRAQARSERACAATSSSREGSALRRTATRPRKSSSSSSKAEGRSSWARTSTQWDGGTWSRDRRERESRTPSGPATVDSPTWPTEPGFRTTSPYSRSGKVYLRGVGLMTKLDPLDYWDGED